MDPPDAGEQRDGTERHRVEASVGRYPPTSAGVEDTAVHGGVAWYRVWAANAELRWSFWARYRSFSAFHGRMVGEWEERNALIARLPPFPTKRSKIIVDHACRHFVRQRQVLLAHYVASAVAAPALTATGTLLEFLLPGPHAHGVTVANATTSSAYPADADCGATEHADLLAGLMAAAAAASGVHVSTSPVSVVSHASHASSAGDVQEVTSVRVPVAQVLREHVIYQVELSNSAKASNFSSWVVLKRFKEFVALRAAMLEALDPHEAALLPPLPRRRSKVLVDHLERGFIEERRLLLQDWLRIVSRMPQTRNIPAVLQFLGV